MTKTAFEYIDDIYKIIGDQNYNYRKSAHNLINLENEIKNTKLEKNAYYHQLLFTIEYFIHLSHCEITPYKTLLPKNQSLFYNFTKSISLDNNNPPLEYLFALYLYKTGDFSSAKKHFSQIDKKYYLDLNVIEQLYKIEELIICCKIFLDEINEEEILKFLKEIRNNDDSTFPDELIETLSHNKKYYTDNIKDEIKK